jgi:hypothetical protein
MGREMEETVAKIEKIGSIIFENCTFENFESINFITKNTT